MKKEIIVKGVKVQVIEQNNSDFISLTDMTSGFKEGSGLIGKWISNKNTLEYIGIWEKIHNLQQECVRRRRRRNRHRPGDRRYFVTDESRSE